MQNKILITLLAIVLCTACKKNTTTEEPPKVYTPSQTGENILYCKINGEERLFEKIYDLFDNDNVKIYTPHLPDSSAAGVFVLAYGTPEISDYMQLYVEVFPEKVNDRDLIPELNKPYFITHHLPYKQSIYTSDKHYFVDSTVSTMTFTRFDDSVASGTFYFEAYSEDNKKVTATEGFFDIKRD